jgi:hypothetical protein
MPGYKMMKKPSGVRSKPKKRVAKRQPVRKMKTAKKKLKPGGAKGKY